MTDIEQVRLLIGDTGSVQFTDAQIQAFLDMASGDVNMAAAIALEAWAAELASKMGSETIGDYSYKRQVDNMLKVADRLRKVATETPASAVAAFDWDEGNTEDVE